MEPKVGLSEDDENNGGGDDEGNGGGETEELEEDGEEAVTAAWEEGLVRKLKACGDDATVHNGSEARPPSSALSFAVWGGGGERGGRSGERGRTGEEILEDEGETGDGDEETLCISGTLERLGARFGEVGTAMFEEPEMRKITDFTIIILSWI